jgi:hypothetical protein
VPCDWATDSCLDAPCYCTTNLNLITATELNDLLRENERTRDGEDEMDSIALRACVRACVSASCVARATDSGLN